MKIDATLPTADGWTARDAAARLESEGFSGAWASEIKHDPFLTLATAAANTQSMTLGTSVVIAFARNPMSVAISANDVQTLTGGRLILGLGSQVKAHITRRYAMPWSEPAARMREFVLALRAIWDCWNDRTPLNFRGRFYSHTLMPSFFDPGPNPFGRPRVYLAGVGPHMTCVAGEVADGFLGHAFTTERYLHEVTLPALASGARTAGRSGSTEVCVAPLVATGSTEQQLAAAIADVRRQIAFYGSTPAYRPVLELHGWGDLASELHALSTRAAWDAMAALIDDDALNTLAVVGSPADVARDLLRRFGDIAARLVLYSSYQIEDGLLSRIAADLIARVSCSERASPSADRREDNR